MHPEGFVGYTKASPIWSKTIKEGFPSTLREKHLPDDIHTALFKPRNRIIHRAAVKFTKQDVLRARNVALLTLTILGALGREKQVAFGKELDAPR